MKKLFTAILIIASTQTFAQCGLFHCNIDLDIQVINSTSSNNSGNISYWGNGDLYEYSIDSLWTEKDFIGTFHLKTPLKMKDSSKVITKGYFFVDTLILHSYDTVEVGDSIRFSYIINLGIGNCIVFTNIPTNWAMFDNPIPNFPIIPCNKRIVGISSVIKRNTTKNQRKGIYDMLGRKLDYEPLNQIYLKDGAKNIKIN